MIKCSIKKITKCLVIVFLAASVALLGGCFGKVCTVSFDAQGGTSVSSMEANRGETIDLPSTSRSGYAFNGWYTSASGGSFVGGADDSYYVSKDVTLYASWQNGSNNGGGGGNGGNGGNSGNTTIDKAKLITVGYSSLHTIASSGEHWFKFTGTGDPVIFETTGNVVDTYIGICDRYSSWYAAYSDDNSGEGNNALCSFISKSETTYWIKVTAKSGTSGAYTLVVKSPTSNLKTNPITLSVGNPTSHTIYRDGTHWFIFTGTGERVFFETEGGVVNTNIEIYAGDTTSYSYSKGSSGEDKGINFITVSGKTYYIKITGNSGTYTFNLHNGTGDGGSQYNAMEVASGYSSSHTITSSGEHWFLYYGTGNSVTFKTTGNVVDTYIGICDRYSSWYAAYSDDNSGEGNNALKTLTTKSGTNYWIRVTAKSSTNGTYTFVVE